MSCVPRPEQFDAYGLKRRLRKSSLRTSRDVTETMLGLPAIRMAAGATVEGGIPRPPLACTLATARSPALGSSRPCY